MLCNYVPQRMQGLEEKINATANLYPKSQYLNSQFLFLCIFNVSFDNDGYLTTTRSEEAQV